MSPKLNLNKCEKFKSPPKTACGKSSLSLSQYEEVRGAYWWALYVRSRDGFCGTRNHTKCLCEISFLFLSVIPHVVRLNAIRTIGEE